LLSELIDEETEVRLGPDQTLNHPFFDSITMGKTDTFELSSREVRKQMVSPTSSYSTPTNQSFIEPKKDT
jgi:hypothetical protein